MVVRRVVPNVICVANVGASSRPLLFIRSVVSYLGFFGNSSGLATLSYRHFRDGGCLVLILVRRRVRPTSDLYGSNLYAHVRHKPQVWRRSVASRDDHTPSLLFRGLCDRFGYLQLCNVYRVSSVEHVGRGLPSSNLFYVNPSYLGVRVFSFFSTNVL